MYLKSIEIQGFKSFANKMKFDFHTGITGIVGPNGSGKSNVADAVRWVLGEQSAKQLRGSKMEDVIFAGTQTRKPVGYAYVSITLDNSGHALPVEYDEVTVTRKVFRSGESEYQLNGHSCRLKDISELFYDTGIGKEGYSIIGQGQIDKILNGKPEERRELFDEAAGIVKFKRRKAAAAKKLENERQNLTRVNDILSELEKQVGPLEQQAEKAKAYLRLKTALKTGDVNVFLLETEKIRAALKELGEKQSIARADLSKVQSEYDSTKAEYEAAEEQLSGMNQEIEETAARQSDTELDKQRMEGNIRLYEEQIKTIGANHLHYNERIDSMHQDLAVKQAQLDRFEAEQKELALNLEEYERSQAQAVQRHQEITAALETVSTQIEQNKKSIYELLNTKSAINADNQRYQTMLEQYDIRRAELNSRMIRGKSDENEQEQVIGRYREALAAVNGQITGLAEKIRQGNERVSSVKAGISELTAEIDKLQQQYHREKSRLESLVNITERYDGYGNSIRKIMERKAENKGILGVIADLIKVEKQYETAIETALGGTIQNIVTDNEHTAKGLITYLKEHKLGRATFLPLSAVSGRNTLEKDPCLQEAGVIGIASSLVRVSFEYENLARYLLGRVLVVDHIDHALAIAKKYKHSLRIVTLEGEQLNPGGSMTGGAFKNAGNLLGRRREIEELKDRVTQLGKQVNDRKAAVADHRKELSGVREQLERDNKQLREAQLERNTAEMHVGQAEVKKQEIAAAYGDAGKQVQALELEIQEIKNHLSTVTGSLESLDQKKTDSQKEIDLLTVRLEEKKKAEAEHLQVTEKMKMEYSALQQKVVFSSENRQRVETEIKRLTDEEHEILEKIAQTNTEVLEKQQQIEQVRAQVAQAEKQIEACAEKAKLLRAQRDLVNSSHKAFFEKREQLAGRMNDLDKECYRLKTQQEKLEEENDDLAAYMWNEYELTYNYALALKDPSMGNLAELKKQTAALKQEIRELGSVNVNAIEEYKEVYERYLFLKNQHDDLIEAEGALTQVIKDLDTGMRLQFEQKFNEIRAAFDRVFKELFGGGRATIELVAGEDLLEAGILIISQPPGKKLQNMMQLSGGEKALTAISLLFAIQNLKPSPFCLLDEIEAALDDSNVSRYAQYLHKLTKHTQFIVITHRRGTMAASDRLYGITMQEKGVSTLVSVDLIADDLEQKELENA